MSVSIEEALNGAGYDFSKEEDCLWLVGQTGTLEELIVRAEDLIEKFEDERSAKTLLSYRLRWRSQIKNIKKGGGDE